MSLLSKNEDWIVGSIEYSRRVLIFIVIMNGNVLQNVINIKKKKKEKKQVGNRERFKIYIYIKHIHIAFRLIGFSNKFSFIEFVVS